MSVQELTYVDENGKTRKKWRVRVKSGGAVVTDQMFHKKGDAELWEAEQKRKLYLGEFVSPKAGKELLGVAVDRWRVQREGTVASKTHNTELYALKHLESLRKRPLATVSAADLNALYASMLKKLSRDTVVRFRQIVSAFYSWAVSEKLVAKNPVLDSKVPAGTAQRARKEIFPFTYAELVAVHAVLVANTSKPLADIMLVLGLTGIR